MPYSIATLNAMSQADFVAALGGIFEHTPEIAASAWNHRPFADREALADCLVRRMYDLSPEAQLALIRAHPDLGSRMRMAEASVTEQAGVGLDRLTLQEYEELQQLNTMYKAKYGFPFLIAVREHSKSSILAAFRQRLTHSVAIEQEQALAEIVKIAKFRLMDCVTTTSAQ